MRKKILIVDDEPDHRVVLSTMLDSKGYVCVEATDGVVALEVLETMPIDLVLTDLNMPRMNGLELIEHIAGLTNCQAMPIILVTSQVLDLHPPISSIRNLFAILSKPYEWSSLFSAIEEATIDRDRAISLAV